MRDGSRPACDTVSRYVKAAVVTFFIMPVITLFEDNQALHRIQRI